MTETAAEQWPLRRGSLIYPTPVAIACGRVLRARTAAERVDACLKAAEVLTRYLAAVAVASFASRDDDAEAKLSELSGNLSFGHFLTTVQEVAGAKGNHPAAPLLAQGFKAVKRNKETVRGTTDGALVSLLGLRNDLGHELRNLDEAKAAAIEAASAPATLLVEALDGVEALLSKPLFVVEDQQWTREALVVRRLLLMGESSDPAPQSIKVGHETGGVEETRTPCLAINKTCLQLPPWLLWGIDHGRQNFALLFLDAVEEASARYCTLHGGEQHQNGGIVESIRQSLAGTRRPSDSVVLLDGRHLAAEWADTRKYIEDGGRRQDGVIDWSTFEPTAVAWYAEVLDSTAVDPHALIRDRLLDGRTNFDPHELRQLNLLFGTKATVRAALGRDVLDVRIIDDEAKRPRQRELVESDNLLHALRRAVRFLGEALADETLAAEDLKEMDGGADYLTLREIFVNQAVHQDYRDASAAGQIEVHREKVTVFNTGYSLVPTDKLLDGGKSQSRNPLIARALRLIGFAEISGSGIRAVHRACQQARRRAPTFESNKDTNTFALTLDWSEGAVDVDTYWQTLVGVHLTQRQAAVLNAVASVASATIPVIESATELSAEHVDDAIDFLLLQRVIAQDEANFRLAEHLREKLG